MDDLKNKINKLENRLKKLKLIILIKTVTDITDLLVKNINLEKLDKYHHDLMKDHSFSLQHIFGHLCYKIEEKGYSMLDKNYTVFLSKYLYGDNKTKEFLIKEMDNNDFLLIYYNGLIKKLLLWIELNDISEDHEYIIKSIMYYNSIINEFLSSRYEINDILIEKLTSNNNVLEKTNEEIDISWINMIGGYFTQGSKKTILNNQQPQFKIFIKSFQIADIPVTYSIFLNFVNDKGYYNKDLWSNEGWQWLIFNNIREPYKWIKKNNIWYKEYSNKSIQINLYPNLPITNVSYYEAEAFCNWIGGRLPTESEWEYAATNRGKTIYPWGLDEPDKNNLNIDFKNYKIVNVNNYNKGSSLYNIKDLIGNCWEWCNTDYMPYKNYNSNKYISSLNFNNFNDNKKVLKGGSWATSKYIISPCSRTGIYPDVRIYETGFRVIKNIN